MAFAATGPRLLFLFQADITDVRQKLEDLKNRMAAMGYEMQSSSVIMREVTNSAGQTKIAVSALGAGVEQGRAQFERLVDTLTSVGRIAKQIVGMYTQWTIWQIRLTQYENQLADALRRKDRILRDVVKIENELILATRESMRLRREEAAIAISAMEGDIKTERIKNNLVMTIKRFGIGSAEARDLTLEWMEALNKQAETARRSGRTEEEVRKQIENQTAALRAALSPMEKLGNAGKITADAILKGFAYSNTTLENTITVQDDIARSMANVRDEYSNALKDIEQSLKKYQMAQNETRLLTVMFGFEIVGLGGQILRLASRYGDWTNRMGVLSGALQRVSGGIDSLFTGGLSLTGIMTGLKGAVAGVSTTFSGILPILQTFAIPLLKIIAFVALLTKAFTWLYVNVKPFKDLIDGIARTIGWLAGAIGKFLEAIFGWLTVDVGETAKGISEAFGAGVEAGREAIAPSRQAGGIIPVTGPYTMHAGEIVTPAHKATGVGAGERVENHFHFGDINITVRSMQQETDFRETAVKLRRYMQLEMARTR